MCQLQTKFGLPNVWYSSATALQLRLSRKVFLKGDSILGHPVGSDNCQKEPHLTKKKNIQKHIKMNPPITVESKWKNYLQVNYLQKNPTLKLGNRSDLLKYLVAQGS